MKILGKEADLLIKRPSDVHGGVLQCSNNPGVVVIDLHRERGLVFLARLGADVFTSRFNDAIISSAAPDGPPVGGPCRSLPPSRTRGPIGRRSPRASSLSAPADIV